MAKLGLSTLPSCPNAMIATFDDGALDENEEAFAGRIKREKKVNKQEMKTVKREKEDAAGYI